MNCDPTLTREEFKQLHNALWELDQLADPRVSRLVEHIRSVALKGAYQQDDLAFDRLFNHYADARQAEGFRAIWSIFEVEDLYEAHPGPADAFVVYKGQHCAVQGSRWLDLYRAANQCIINSGDLHHIFIEHFELKNGNELHLTTGS